MTTALIRYTPNMDLLFEAHLLCDVCGEQPWTQHARQHPRAVICHHCASGEPEPVPAPRIHTDAEYRQWARDEYQCTDIEIDDDARLSRADDGVWVQAWVWVYAPEPDEGD